MSDNKVTIIIPLEIRNDKASFEFFAKTLNSVSKTTESQICFDFRLTSWFEANLTSVLGIIFSIGFINKNEIFLRYVNSNIQKIFRKNNFYKTYGLGADIDTHNSTIKYTIFNSENKPEFSKYIKNELIPKIKVSMSNDFRSEFRLALEELFQNARTHGKCDYIYTCGQYFPSNRRVNFTVIDLGKTICENVRTYLGDTFIQGDYAIDWATVEGNSTRVKGETGGIGIPLIRDFLTKNQGKIQIISSNGYWEELCGEKYQCRMEHAFPGTIVNIEVNINDWNTYITENEKYTNNNHIENIF